MRKNERKYKKEEDSTCVLPSVNQPKTPFRLEILLVPRGRLNLRNGNRLHINITLRSSLFFKLMNDGKPAANQQFRILVKGDGGESTVQILTREGGVDNSETAKKILGLLYDQLK